jgi:hypothetical protein
MEGVSQEGFILDKEGGSMIKRGRLHGSSNHPIARLSPYLFW